jgi:hypothetical protein
VPPSRTSYYEFVLLILSGSNLIFLTLSSFFSLLLLLSSHPFTTLKGWRSHMEDAHIACLDLKTDLPAAKLSEERRTFLEGIAVFGVFDGHGGTYVFSTS